MSGQLLVRSAHVTRDQWRALYNLVAVASGWHEPGMLQRNTSPSIVCANGQQWTHGAVSRHNVAPIALSDPVGRIAQDCHRQAAASHERCSASRERHTEVRPRSDTAPSR